MILDFGKKFFSIALVILLVGCQPSPQLSNTKKFSETQMLMGTVVRLDVCYFEQETQRLKTVVPQVWSRLEDISRRMSIQDQTSDVYRINHAQGEPVTVGEDTYQLLKASKHYWGVTKKTFDITVLNLIRLWKSAEKKGQIPTLKEIRTAQNSLGVSSLAFLPGNQVRLTKKNVEIDLGGIAKGYALDEGARILRENGFRNFLIDAGGDVFAGGCNCESQPWKIGLRDPRNPQKVLDVLYLSNMAVTTSGDYERYYKISGQRWSHIMNPITGYPSQGILSTTVVAPVAQESDAFSTSLCILGRNLGIDLIDSLGESFAALIVESSNGKDICEYKSKHYSKFQKMN